MNTIDRNCKNRLPQWQSERMRSLIEERWSEVWEIVVARENSDNAYILNQSEKAHTNIN